MELDCHGKTWAEALAEFIARYNGALQAGSGDTLDIIHGYGSTGAGGTIRARLRAFLGRYSDRLEWQPGESVDGNHGHTLVRPGRPLPEAGDLLAEQVWEYCARPRTASKITGKFRRHGDDRTLEAIRALEREGRLRSANRGRVKTYQAVYPAGAGSVRSRHRA